MYMSIFKTFNEHAHFIHIGKAQRPYDLFHIQKAGPFCKFTEQYGRDLVIVYKIKQVNRI